MAKQSRWVRAAALAALAAVAAYWYWSPLLVVHQMKEAVRTHDVEAFNSHVDFPALRENMKDEIAGRPGDGALDGLGRMLGGVVVDALVRPEAVMFVLEHGDFAKKKPRDQPRDELPPPEAGKAKWVAEREGVNRYIVHNDKVTLVMVRSGFADWKLSELHL